MRDQPDAFAPRTPRKGFYETASITLIAGVLALGCTVTDRAPPERTRQDALARPASASGEFAVSQSDEAVRKQWVEHMALERRPVAGRVDEEGSKGSRDAPSARTQPAAPLGNALVAGQSVKHSTRARRRAQRPDVWRAAELPDRERYAAFEANGVKRVSEHPVSTFSIDVDTGAYANVRRFLRGGRLPPRHAVRVEEFINYFDYVYEGPRDQGVPFAVHTAIAPAPWGENRHLLRIGIKGLALNHDEIPPANLVFLIDVSGSMGAANKLQLLKPALQGLARRLRPEDSVAIVVYAGASGVVLEPTAGGHLGRIGSALAALTAGGSTNGGSGIRLAYKVARSAFKPGGVNRIILATDGDFNVGTRRIDALEDLVRRECEGGVSLTTLGFGAGNYNEPVMERLANLGNGNYAYIDSLHEANKVLGHQMAGTLATIAKDVKIQIEFNPAVVSEYRLIGYENRALAREDFGNDKVDAGEIGAGHRMTALYELVFAGSGGERSPPLRYGGKRPEAAFGSELGYLKLRYKDPGGDISRLLSWALDKGGVLGSLGAADPDFRFAAAVAGFGQWLRGEAEIGGFGPVEIEALGRGALASDVQGYRREFLSLVSTAATLQGESTQAHKVRKAVELSQRTQ